MCFSELNQFVRKTALAALLTLVAAVVITAIQYTFWGERPWQEVESPHLVARDRQIRSDGSCTTLFVGSSMTFRQINPATYDVLLGVGQSCNLGNPGMFPPRSLAYLEQLLNDPPERVSRIYFELYGLDEVRRNYSSPEIMRIMTPRVYFGTLQTITKANFSTRYKFFLARQYTRAFMFKYLGFGLLSYRQQDRAMKPFVKERLHAAVRGYYPKDTDLATTRYPDYAEKLQVVRGSFESDPTGVRRRRDYHAEKYQRPWSVAPNYYSEQLNTLIAKAAAQGIDLICFLPPLLQPVGVEFAYPWFLQLPPSNRIDLSDPGRYPELFQAEYQFDFEHVNSRGAEWLTRYLVEETQKLRGGSQAVDLPSTLP